MQVLQIVILAIFFIVCGVLIFLILIQSGRGGGLGVIGGGGSQSAFGSSTMDVVTKATWWGALGFFVLAVLAAIAFSDTGPKLPDTPGLDSGLAPLDGAVPDAPPAEEAGQPDAEPVAPADPE